MKSHDTTQEKCPLQRISMYHVIGLKQNLGHQKRYSEGGKKRPMCCGLLGRVIIWPYCCGPLVTRMWPNLIQWLTQLLKEISKSQLLVEKVLKCGRNSTQK